MGVPFAEVIGDPIAHSKSPLIHKFWLGKLGIEGEYRRTRVTPGELPAFLASRREDPHWRGCNVTMPLKTAVGALLDRLDAEAAFLGAVNTVVPQQEGLLIGYNTDVSGFAAPLLKRSHLMPDYGNHVATYVQIVGAGGAARAAVRGAMLVGFGDFEFFSRRRESALLMTELTGLPEWFANDIDSLGPIRNPEDGPEDQRYSHLVVNATPLGMDGHPPLEVDLSRYYPDTIVFDLVYAPVDTPLLQQARARGLATIDGLEMLVEQASEAFHHFFGAPAPREHDAELRELLTR
jgi:shikimate dehydrogenase